MSNLHLRAIHIAVLQNDLVRVRTLLLHRKKSSLNQRDNKGATPLMLAALIASPKIVTLLLEKGASWELQDESGCVAYDYVDGAFAEVMRARYKRLTKRSTAGRGKQKRQIQMHLNDIPALKTQYRTKAAGTLMFERHGSSLRIAKLIGKVTVAGRIAHNTTAACIAAGGTIKPLQCAVSGWTPVDSPGVLNAATYTQVVRDIAKILEFDLPKHCYDTPGGGSLEENIGRFYAVWLRDPWITCDSLTLSSLTVKSCLRPTG